MVRHCLGNAGDGCEGRVSREGGGWTRHIRTEERYKKGQRPPRMEFPVSRREFVPRSLARKCGHHSFFTSPRPRGLSADDHDDSFNETLSRQEKILTSQIDSEAVAY